ncbi:helix-turn-helix transcriptional regulator [Clostridiaceae bacterium M8S5]|nr:helix-turn-helix transcriptional regulator [Clostridiaceae bacterium M8S5]
MISERIKQLRKDRNITQSVLANHIGVSTSIIGMYETNARKPSYEALLKIANYFNVATDYLMGNDLYDANSAEEKIREIGMDYIDLALKFKEKNISAKDVEKILEIMEDLKK